MSTSRMIFAEARTVFGRTSVPRQGSCSRGVARPPQKEHRAQARQRDLRGGERAVCHRVTGGGWPKCGGTPAGRPSPSAVPDRPALSIVAQPKVARRSADVQQSGCTQCLAFEGVSSRTRQPGRTRGEVLAAARRPGRHHAVDVLARGRLGPSTAGHQARRRGSGTRFQVARGTRGDGRCRDL